MEKTEEEIASICAYRKAKHLNSNQKGKASQFIEPDDEPTTYHFYNYDPEIGQTDLHGISVQREESREQAVFSIPLSFTESSKTTYEHHDQTELGYDIRLYTTRNNAPAVFHRK